jgi:ubiquinone/menaquinone biosynthesis C-methylase UbiE
MTSAEIPRNPDADLKALATIYRERWHRHGVSPLSLGWTKGKQHIRFDVLLSGLPCEGRSFLDVGCGFGDLNVAIRSKTENYRYLGIDMVPEFITQGQTLYGSPHVSFAVGDFLTAPADGRFDYAIASGLFGYKLTEVDNYEYIARTLQRMFSQCTDAVCVDFLSDQATFRRDHNFYTTPSRVMDIAFSLTRNLRLRHDYMPFEFALTLFKNDHFDEDSTVFTR